jgi:Ca2+-transporting ATPase
MENVSDDVMEKEPRPKNEGIFANGLGLRVAMQGLMFAFLSLVGYYLGNSYIGPLGGQTMTFLVLSLSQVFQSYNMRSHLSLFKIGPFSNIKLNTAALISILSILLVLLTPISIAFNLVRLPLELYLYGFILATIPIIVIEILKALGLIKP